jgi:hypothetical protein
LDFASCLSDFGTRHEDPIGQSLVIAFIELPQGDVIERILQHCGLWCPSSPRAPPTEDLRVHDPDGNWESDSASQEPRELTFVDEAMFPRDLLIFPRRRSGNPPWISHPIG